MNTFQVRRYAVPSPGITGDPVTFAVISDLHGVQYGKNNAEILRTLEREKPDAVLLAGDLSVNTDYKTYGKAAVFLKSLAKSFPVYYAFGNHESRMAQTEENHSFMEHYQDYLRKHGVFLLRNEKACARFRGTRFCFYGLEIPLEYYRKPRSPRLAAQTVRSLLGSPEGPGIQVLLAHNPKYGDAYFEWGADFVFSGHYHGGAVRLTEHMGLISPQFGLFPRYCCGDFHRGHQHMYVSPGMGEHTIPVRIHNPHELLVVKLIPWRLYTGAVNNCKKRQGASWQYQ